MDFLLRHRFLAAIVVVGVAFWVWLSWPPSELALDPDCQIEDPTAMVSEALYGRAFWRAQQRAIEASIQGVEIAQAEAEQARNEPPPQRKESPLEMRMRRLSRQAAAENEIEQRKRWHDQLDWLAKCDVIAVSHLQPPPPPPPKP